MSEDHFNDPNLELDGGAEAALAPRIQQEPSPHYQPAYMRGLNPLTAEELLSRDIKPREKIMSPWLPKQGLAMIHAPRGVGKTQVAVGIACAVAAGTGFLRWKADFPRKVLLIDGEMPAYMLKERFARTIDAIGMDFSPDNLKLVASDLEPDGLPDLADEGAQQYYTNVIAPADLVIVDNLSTICRSLRENDADSWGPVQDWALGQRRAGKSALFVHHANKNGGQRGTSRKEDILDSVISLKRPPNYSAEQGARFEVRYDKSRGFWGDEAEPFEAWLRDGSWKVSDIKSSEDDVGLKTLQSQGCSVREISERTGMSKSTVARKLKAKHE